MNEILFDRFPTVRVHPQADASSARPFDGKREPRHYRLRTTRDLARASDQARGE